jgi:hypothetical protein
VFPFLFANLEFSFLQDLFNDIIYLGSPEGFLQVICLCNFAFGNICKDIADL